MLFAAISLHAANFDFRELPFEKKISGKDLSFAVTFDKMQTNADFAAGNPMSSLAKLPLGLRNLVGIDGKNAFSPEGRERLFFFADRNIDIAKGTIVMWVRCDYPLENCENAALFKVSWDMETENQEKTTLFAYIFKGRVYACWESFVPPVGFGNIRRHVQNGARINAREGEWFQVVVTWDQHALKVYVNGELGDSITMAKKYSKVVSIGYDKDTSILGLKDSHWGDKNKVRTVIDDIKVFTRVMEFDEIKANYAEMVINPARRPSFADIRLSGIEKDPTTMEAEINIIPIANSKAENASVVLTGPDGFRRTETIPAKGKTVCLFKDVTKQGEYTLTVTLDPKTSAPLTAAASIRTPDLSFIGFRGGDEDSVPAPFPVPEIDSAKKSIKLYNKTLYFDDTPYPCSIKIGGRELFSAAPALKVAGAKIRWGKSVLRSDGRNGAVLTGSGKLGQGTVDFKTTIEFDGLCRTILTLRDIKELPPVSVTWQVAPEFCKYLQVPRMAKSRKIASPWPLSTWTDPYLLWFASEQGGWSWMAESDANWRYKTDDRIFFADWDNGRCEVKIITFKTKVPKESIDINTGLFMATPTRPLTARRRGWRYGGHPLEGGFDETMGHIALWGGLRMHKDFELLFPYVTGVSAAKLKNTRKYHCIYYGMTSPWGSDFFRYFKKYVAEPGSYTYTSNHLRDPRNDKVVARGEQNPCRMSSELYHDYVMWHFNKLLTHRYAGLIRMYYNDLCGTRPASSPHDFLVDAYGRTTAPFDTAGVRKFLFRQLRMLRKTDIPFMLHGQNCFTPAIHSLADFWLPGEQYEPEVRRTQDPRYYSRIPDAELLCEANSKVLGVSVLFLPAGISYRSTPKRKFDANAYVNSLAAKLLPYDIEFKGDKWFWHTAYWHGFRKLWDNLEKGGVYKENIIAYRWFDKMPIGNSNRNVRIAAYDIRDGRWFLVLGNITGKVQKTVIDLKKITGKSFELPELHSGGKVQVKNGVFEVTVPEHNIRLFSIPVR